MARAVKQFKYGFYPALASKAGNDIERMNPIARKAYFERRLRLIGTQIHLLSSGWASEEDLVGDWMWSVEPLDDDRWASLVSLDYLLSARDALIETIETL